MDIRPFTIEIPQHQIDDLAARLEATRWPNAVAPAAEERGMSLAWLRSAAEHWRTSFDWRAIEKELNRLPQFTADVGGTALHVVHARGHGDKVPVLLVHGWPDSFLRYRAVIPLLVAAGHDVIVPSLPGFAFSGQPDGPLRLAGAAEQLHTLVTGLGYQRYAVSGGDWGAGIADHLATTHPEAIAALHLTDVPFTKSFQVDRSAVSAEEQDYLATAGEWFQQAAYFGIQAAEPTALASGLSDSPTALLAWIAGKIRDWSDAEPDLSTLLTEVSVHWFTNDARSSLRLYSEAIDPSAWAGDDEESGDAGAGRDGGGSGSTPAPSVPTGLTFFPHDFVTAPRAYAERFYDVRRCTMAPSGGHFGAVELPAFFADEVVALLTEVSQD